MFIEKKLDGLHSQIHKKGNKVIVYSDDGSDLTSRLPQIVKEVRKLKEDCIFDVELELWAPDHKPREEMAAYIHAKKTADDSNIVANIFDLLWYDDKSLHNEPLEDRPATKDLHNEPFKDRRVMLEEKFKFEQSTIGKPDTKIKLNLVPSDFCDTEAEVKAALNKYAKALASEGAMVKLENMLYKLGGMSSQILKLKTYGELHCKIWKVNETKVSNVFNYDFALAFTEQDKVDEKSIIEIEGKKYTKAGRSYDTGTECKVGDIATIKFHTINLYKNPETGRISVHLYEPIFYEKTEENEPDSISTAIRVGKEAEILEEKLTKQKFSEAVRPPFGSPGGKRYMADRLIRMFPEHKVYCEPFVGAGGVFYKKKKIEGVKEVINDLDKDIIHCFKTIQNLTETQWSELKKMNWTASKAGFKKTKKSFESSTGLKRFHDVIYLKQFSDVSELKTYDDRDDGKTWAGIRNLMNLKNRLKGAIILNQDYRTIIKKYDSKETFFYIDPPYPRANLNWKYMPKETEVEATMKSIKGKFLLSYELTKAFKNFKKKTISLWAIGNPGQHHRGTFKTEQLVMNYESERNTRYLESSDLDAKGWLDIFHEHFVANGYSKNWLKLDNAERHEKICEALIDFDLDYDDKWVKDIIGHARYKKYNHIASSLDIILSEQQDPYLRYPSEALTYQCVFQHHYRSGKIDPKIKKKATSVHTDLRMENLEKKFLIGFTLLDQMPGIIDEEIATYPQALKWDKSKDAFKINWNTGEWKKRMKKGAKKTIDISLVALKKSIIPLEWLTVKGVVAPGSPGATALGPGVFTIVDKGSVEYLSQKAWSHEYAFHCNKIDYRIVFRRLTLPQREAIQDPFMKLVFLNNLFEYPLDGIFQDASDNPQKVLESLDLSLEAEIVPAKVGGLGKDQSGWIAIKTVEQMPYVLSRGAINKNFIPPKNISAVTSEIRKQIPDEFQYWKKDVEKERIEIRNNLYEAMKKKEVDIKIKESWLQEIENLFEYDPTALRTKILMDDARIVYAWYAIKKRGGTMKYSFAQIERIAKRIHNELKLRSIEFNSEKMKPTSKELFDKITESEIITKIKFRLEKENWTSEEILEGLRILENERKIL